LKKIVTIVGARPQFVKAAMVGRALAQSGKFNEIMIHTGQHFDDAMSDIFFRELGIAPPRHHLDIHGGGHGEMTGRMLAALEPLLETEKPDWVLVYGDTNSTLAGALAAAKLNIPIAHVEAGLRSFNRHMPEETNRVLTDHMSSLLFCPTAAAIANLAHEGVAKGVHAVGDVMYDAALAAAPIARSNSTILKRLGLPEGGFAVATIHRAENTDDPKRLAEVVAWLVARAKEHPVVWPLHPRSKAAAERDGLDLSRLTIIEPVGFIDMTRLVLGASIIYTDSGGVQKEAYFHGKPCVTLREETEWVETVECGWNRLWRQPSFKSRQPIKDYGEGDASRKIAELLERNP
jgi:UDP-GlcNAc3NAcA epimerase